MAVDGRANWSSANFSKENVSFMFPSQFDTRHLKANKSKLIWPGSFEELFDFAEKYLNVNREMAKLSVNDSKKTIKADHLILNWYETTGTLQLQGPQATDYKAFLNRRLLDAEIESESHNSRYSDDAITAGLKETEAVSQTEAVSPDDLIKGQFPAEVVSTPIFLKELEKIWTEIKSLHNRFAKIYQPQRSDMNNIQLINTLRQENHDLSQEICMLKGRLQEESNMLKKDH